MYMRQFLMWCHPGDNNSKNHDKEKKNKLQSIAHMTFLFRSIATVLMSMK